MAFSFLKYLHFRYIDDLHYANEEIGDVIDGSTKTLDQEYL